MNKHSMVFSGMMRVLGLAAMLFFTVGYSSVTNAAQGCGHGFHQSIHGGCVVNHPGAGATAAPMHPGCWRNAWGQLRCH